MHLQCESTLGIHKELYICHSCGKAAMMQLRTVSGCYSHLSWVSGILEDPGYLDTWLLFCTDAKLITVPAKMQLFSLEKKRIPLGQKLKGTLKDQGIGTHICKNLNIFTSRTRIKIFNSSTAKNSSSKRKSLGMTFLQAGIKKM